MSTPKSAISPYLGLALGVGAVSTASIFIRFAQGLAMPSLIIAAYRLGLASLMLLPVVALRHQAELRRLTRREWLLATLSGVFLAAHFGTWITSLAYTSVANSAVLVSTSPLFVALIAVTLLGERLSPWTAAGLAVTVAGGLLVAVSDACLPTVACAPGMGLLQSGAARGNGLALAGAATVAVYFILGKTLRQSLSLMVYIFLTYGMAAVTLWFVVGVARLPATGYPLQAYVWCLLLALVPQLLGHSAFNWALRYLPATFVSLLILCEPIGSTLLAVWFFAETPTPLKILGGLLTLAGVVLASRATVPARPPVPPKTES